MPGPVSNSYDSGICGAPDHDPQLRIKILQEVCGNVQRIIADEGIDVDPRVFGMLCFIEGVRSGLDESARRAFDFRKAGATADIYSACKSHLSHGSSR